MLEAIRPTITQVSNVLADSGYYSEAVFGIIKQAIGFLLRGQEKVDLEWTLVSTSYNPKRLFNLAMSRCRKSDGRDWIGKKWKNLENDIKGSPSDSESHPTDQPSRFIAKGTSFLLDQQSKRSFELSWIP